MKFEFTYKDFYRDTNAPHGLDKIIAESYAKEANETIAPLLARLEELEKMIENAPVVYGQYGGSRPQLWDEIEGGKADTHRAKLVQIEEIK